MPYHTTHGEGCGLLHQGCPPAVLSFPLGRYCEGHLPYAWARLNCHLVSRFCNLRGFPCLSVRGRIAFPSYNPATSSRFMLLHRGNSRLNGRGAFPYRQRVPRSPYCWKSAVGAFRFSYEEERLGGVSWRIHPSGLDGRRLPVRAARIGGGSWGGVRFRGFVLRSVQRDPAGRIGRLAACAAAGDEVGKPAQTGRLRQALMFGFASRKSIVVSSVLAMRMSVA